MYFCKTFNKQYNYILDAVRIYEPLPSFGNNSLGKFFRRDVADDMIIFNLKDFWNLNVNCFIFRLALSHCSNMALALPSQNP